MRLDHKKPLKKTRIKVYNTQALPVLLYGSETQTIKASDARRPLKRLWIRETGTGQQVAQLHERYMMMMMMFLIYLGTEVYLSSSNNSLVISHQS